MGKVAKLTKAGEYGKKAAVNRRFKTRHKVSYSGTDARGAEKANVGLREIQEWLFDKVLKLTSLCLASALAGRSFSSSSHPSIILTRGLFSPISVIFLFLSSEAMSSTFATAWGAAIS